MNRQKIHTEDGTVSFDFSEKVVMITGAGRGIGRGVAEGYAANGAHVVLLDQDAQSGKDAVKDICSGGGLSLIHI